MNTLVKEVITNTSSFERIQSDSAMDLSVHSNSRTADSFMGADLALSKSGKQENAVRPSSHRLVVYPHFPFDSGVSHGCKLCPANLCKVNLQRLCSAGHSIIVLVVSGLSEVNVQLVATDCEGAEQYMGHMSP